MFVPKRWEQSLKDQNLVSSTEDPAKYLQLKKYLVVVTNYLHWQVQDWYFGLINDFLNFKLIGKKFDTKFSTLVNKIESETHVLFKNSADLLKIIPDKASNNFEI